MSKRNGSAPYIALLSLLTFGLALGLALGAAGCKKEKEIVLDQGSASMGTNVPQMPQVPTTVVVPPEVAKQWKSVVLEVTDKDTRKVETFTFKIGETAPLGKTGLTVWVEAFLPSFSMQGESFTSTSNELNNPAARVKITDKDGKQLFYSWLFALYPTTHPVDHPKYAVVLKDYKKN
jgi:hypothetical protein